MHTFITLFEAMAKIASPGTAGSAWTELEIIKLIVPLLLGGIVGALLGHWLGKKRAAVELTASVAQKYLDEFTNYKAGLDVFLHKPHSATNHDENLARRIGDWWEIVAAYRSTGLVNPRLFRQLGLEDQLLQFCETVRSAAAAPGSQFQDAAKWWPNLFSTK